MQASVSRPTFDMNPASTISDDDTAYHDIRALSPDSFSSPTKEVETSSSDNGVGLSNPQLSTGRRRMLDLVNKLHSTGYVLSCPLSFLSTYLRVCAGFRSISICLRLLLSAHRARANRRLLSQSQASPCLELQEPAHGSFQLRCPPTSLKQYFASCSCPSECRLSRSEGQWQCTVSLRFITDPIGQPLGQARNQPFGDIIYDKGKVEERIRRAQRAILNPGKPAKHFLEGDDDDTLYDAELSFSINCVTLQISGPDVADLSFCDLPGEHRVSPPWIR